ncbi:glycoside hydrolase family 16 protein [Pseudobacillus sp. FSL P4-0506]|uniref:glycoside hydrolase family 16 protein n=1 Tax=unclassified Pseudobacillus TaxID=2619284 RepID=UPI0030FAC8A4
MKKILLLSSFFLFMTAFSLVLLLSLKENRNIRDLFSEKVHFTRSTTDTFHTWNDQRWEVRERFKLGRGYLLSQQIEHTPGSVKIKLNHQTADGGEIRTRNTFQYGQFEAAIKVAHASGSITGFFLYAPPDLHHEIDIEIFNEPESKALFTIYQDGRVAKQQEYTLPFDPTEEFHDYRMDILPEETRFLIDGKVVQSWEGNFSSSPMQLMINSWYPSWLDIQGPALSATVINKVSYKQMKKPTGMEKE